MKKKNTIPSAFDDVLNGMGFGNTEHQEEVTDMNRVDSIVDVETFTNNEPEPPKEPEEKKPVDTTNGEDTTEIPQEVLNLMNQTEPPADNGLNDHDDEPTVDDLTEAQQVGAFFDAVAEKFGWDAIDQDDKPVSVDEFTQYIQDVVNENSIPRYADERVEQLDTFIKNGGKFEDFYKIQQQQISYDNIDLENETNQRAVISDLLRADGYSDQQIARKIDRYESAGVMEEEAEEALGRLKEIRAYEAEQTAKAQEQARIEAVNQLKAFFDDVTKQISGLTNIRGIQIPKEDRNALLEYIFKTDSTGMSQYQKDFNKNLSRNLIESAYFTMRADSFVQEAKKAGQTSAAQKLRQMLRHTSKNHSSYNADEDKQRPAWEIASKLF